MIVVSAENFSKSIKEISADQYVACDTETTSLFPWKRGRLFSIQFSTEANDYYFNFNEYDTGEEVLPFDRIIEMQVIFDKCIIFLQNAKFDMAFLWKEGIRFNRTKIHDTEVAGRLIRSDHMKYSLDEQVKREFGETKDDRTMEWLVKNKCFTAIEIPGKDKIYKAFHFDQVPFDIIAPYGCKDTRLTYMLGRRQLQRLEELAKEAPEGQNSVMTVHQMESALIHACFEIERVGIQIDKEYCDEAIKFESDRIAKAQGAFADLTGSEITDSGKFLGPLFEQYGFPPGKTETGEHEITDSFLSSVSHPIAALVQDYRDARKRANTYFKSYLYFSDSAGALHANMKQAGTKTGRFSYMDPNLQNIPGDDPDSDSVDNSPYPIRRAFIPRPGFFFMAVDYNQMEFRMMLDEAGQHDLIKKIIDGLDPHDATAELTGLKRKAAKTLNFGLLFGMGVDKLGIAIGVTKDVARQFKTSYFSALPMVENFIIQCSGAVRSRHARSPENGFIKTWLGRRSYFTTHPKYGLGEYKATNAKIQGGCADVVKLAMVEIHQMLLEEKSRMVVQIHDEILFEIAFGEEHLITPILKIMETSYPHRFIPLTCSTSFSLKSFYDMEECEPKEWLGKERRNHL